MFFASAASAYPTQGETEHKTRAGEADLLQKNCAPSDPASFRWCDAHVCAVAADASVWCWGDNAKGQLGDGHAGGKAIRPRKAAGLPPAAQVVASGDRTYVRLQDAAEPVRCWGTPGYSRDSALGPTPVANTRGAVELAGSPSTMCIRAVRGEVRCRGSNANGTVGDGTFLERASAVAVRDVHDTTHLSVGLHHSCAIVGGNQLACWGINERGKFGVPSAQT